jgi:hypothetical protein
MNKNNFIKEYHKHLEIKFKRKNPNREKHFKAFTEIYTNSPPEAKSLEDGYKDLVSGYLSDLMKFLPIEITQKIDNDILFDVVANYNFNASCFKIKGEKFIAVVFNSNLFELLNKWAKYHLAVNFPSAVYYENGENSPSHDSIYYKEKVVALKKSFCNEEDISSYDLMLDPKNLFVKDRYFYILYVSELFVLGHELGHIINGDVSDEKNYNLQDNRQMIGKSALEHEKEFNADLVGFKLVLSVLEDKMAEIDNLVLMSIISSLFDFMSYLGATSSYSHPDPLIRNLRLIEQVYGVDEAKFMLFVYKENYIDIDYQFIAQHNGSHTELPSIKLQIEVPGRELFELNYPTLTANSYASVTLLEKGKIANFDDSMMVILNFICESSLAGLTWDFLKRVIEFYTMLIFHDKKQHKRKDKFKVILKENGHEYEITISDRDNLLEIEIPEKLKIMFK